MGNDRYSLVDRREYILRRCKGKRILHLGCTNHPYTAESLQANALLHADLSKVASSIVGVDSDLAGIQKLTELGFENLLLGDLEDPSTINLKDTFDIIIAGEVIEHLTNPGKFIVGLSRFMTPESEILLTTVNAYSVMRFTQYALRGRGGQTEPVHPDHVAYYSIATLTKLFEKCGLTVIESAFYDLAKEHRAYNRAVWNIANDLGVSIFRQLADGIVMVAKRGV
jgi:SAM-dependent methyltransferase